MDTAKKEVNEMWKLNCIQQLINRTSQSSILSFPIFGKKKRNGYRKKSELNVQTRIKKLFHRF